MALQNRSPQAKKRKKKHLEGLWFERLMATLAAVNLGLVLFNLSYIPWRDFYYRVLPQPTLWYGQHFKGIEPHTFTASYLAKVDQLEKQVASTGLRSATSEQLLSELAQQSQEMIDENPFEIANKSGTLERIKDRMRDRIGIDSSSQAFATFWSQDYLSRTGWQDSFAFFNQEISPLIASNYYRHIGFNGQPIDRFWTIDIWFIGLFALEFFVRTRCLSQRHKVSWLDAVVWRWFDLFLLLPFWRFLRVIPVTIRLDRAKLINLSPLHQRVVRHFISGVAVEMTEMVVIRLIDQFQDLIQRGELSRWLLEPTGGKRYIDLNGINEFEKISQHLTQVLLYQVLPKIEPDIQQLLHHTLTSALNRSPLYSNLQQLPGMKDWSNQLTQKLATDVCQNSYAAITAALEDETGAELVKRLVTEVGRTFQSEIQQEGVLTEIESLSIALLDEIKINYVQKVEAEDLETLQASRQQIYSLTRSTGIKNQH